MLLELLVFSTESLNEVFTVWHILWLKRGRKRYIYTPYMPVYPVFILQNCMHMPVLLCCCIYFATISGLCRCCLLWYNIL